MAVSEKRTRRQKIPYSDRFLSKVKATRFRRLRTAPALARDRTLSEQRIFYYHVTGMCVDRLSGRSYEALHVSSNLTIPTKEHERNSMKKSILLINESPLQVLPSLAKAVGLEEAIVLQQLHYWIENPKADGRIEDGHKWIFNTYEEWQKDNFPFWSIQQIQRFFLNLEKVGVVISAKLDAKKHDQKKFYRIDYDALCTMDESILIPSNISDSSDVNKELQRLPENKDILKTDEVQGKYKPGRQDIKGIEAAIWGNRTVTDSDLPVGDEALKAFERDMQCPGSWTWYPVKSKDEPGWKTLREFVIRLYKNDPKAFEKYHTWAGQPYSRGAKSVGQIRLDPTCFEFAWADYLLANPTINSTGTTYTDKDGIPLS